MDYGRSYLLESGTEIFSSLPHIPNRLLSPDIFNIKKQLSAFNSRNHEPVEEKV